MKVSIIVPFWQGTAFLTDCFRSIEEELAQGAGLEIETLLVLDHPKEDVIPVVTEFKEKINVTVLELEEKTGVAAARNTGLEHAGGEFIYFLDADDYLYGGTLHKLISTYEQNPQVDVVYGKKVSSWFKREIFLSSYTELEEEEEKESGEDVSDDEKRTLFSMVRQLFHRETEERDDTNLDRDYVYRRLITKKRGLRNISALHMMIRKSLLDEHQIRFQEQFRFYADLSFTVQVLAYSNGFARNLESYYIKRKHNDPIQQPAISQMQDPEKFKEYLDAYRYACSVIPAEDEELSMRLQRKWVNYYTKFFVTRVRRGKEDYWRQERYQMMREVACEMDPGVYRGMSRYKKKHLKALREGNLAKTQKLTRNHLARKKFFRVIRNKKLLYRTLYTHWFIKMPMVENLVVFESFLGRNYSDSCKYIYRYLKDNYPGKYRFVWILDKGVNIKIDGNPKIVRRFSLGYFYYLGRAKYWVNNMRQPVWLEKREGNVFLATWHGTPLKKLVFDMDEVYSATPTYKKQFYSQSRKWDYLISDNAFSTEVFQSAFLFDKEKILEYGYPRNDLMHAPNREELAASIRAALGIPADKKTVLYAPTWRDDDFYEPGKYKFTLKLDLYKMKEALGDDYVILLRTHYFIADHLEVTGLDGFAYNVSKYPDITELYLISDICITDYSSVFFDYGDLKRPILFYTYDLEKYRDVLRGFYIDIETEVPGPLLYTTEEVIDAIRHIDEVSEQYAQRYEAFYQRFCSLDDGFASKRIVEKVFQES
ncbi:MAG: CDP-glycerol glycerophosphotransferase family protein [Lachnospiraceae bacterium]